MIYWDTDVIYTPILEINIYLHISGKICKYHSLKFYKKPSPFPYKFCNKEHFIFTDYT